MQVTVENVGSLSRLLKVVLPRELVTKKIEDAYRKLGSEAALKGFRRGKIPRTVLEKNFRPKVEYEVGEELIQGSYFDALQHSKLEAVVHPEIKEQSFADDGTFSYAATVDVRPEFELKGYKGMEVEQPEIMVSESEVEAELETLRRENAPLRNVDDRGVQENDIVIIDFQGYADGEAIKQVAGQDYSVDVGSGRNGMEFETLIIGLQKDTTTSRPLSFPASFANPVMAGKDIEFKITVKEIKERLLADLDDEFAKDLGEEFNTLDDLKKHIKAKKLAEKENLQNGDLTDKVMLKLLDEHNFELPERLIQYEIEQLIQDMEGHLNKQGQTMESAGMNRERLAVHYREAAIRRVKGDFILKKVAELEDIKLANEDIDHGFKRISDQYGMPVEEVKKFFSRRDELMPFMHELLNEKILRFLRNEVRVKTVPMTELAQGAQS